MAQAKLSAQWDQTASVIAMIFNTSMARKPGAWVSAEKFHPFRQSAKKKQTTRISFDQAMKRFPGG